MRLTLVLVVALLVTSCEANTPAADEALSVPSSPAATTPAATVVEPACPSDEISGFIDAFVASVEVQKAFTSSSIESQAVDPTAEPEPAIITKQVAASELEFPLIPNKQEQAAQGLSLRQSVLDDGNIKVTVGKADTDQQKSYYFKKGACWQLFRIRNESL